MRVNGQKHLGFIQSIHESVLMCFLQDCKASTV